MNIENLRKFCLAFPGATEPQVSLRSTCSYRNWRVLRTLERDGVSHRATKKSGLDKHMNIEQLRKFCLAFPGATEDIKWGSDLCFSVGAKMFCVTSADASDAGISLKCTPEKFAELIERDGIDPAAYVAGYKWVNIANLRAVTPAEQRGLIKKSYQLVFDKLPPKIKKTIA